MYLAEHDILQNKR